MKKEKTEEIEEEVDFSGIKNLFRKLNEGIRELTEEEKEVIKLKNYIKDKREKGFSDKHITNILVKKGLDDDVIERLFPKKESLEKSIETGVVKGMFRVIIGLLLLIYAIYMIIRHT